MPKMDRAHASLGRSMRSDVPIVRASAIEMIAPVTVRTAPTSAHDACGLARRTKTRRNANISDEATIHRYPFMAAARAGV